MTDVEKLKEKLYQRVFSYLVGNRIYSQETIYQCDWVIQNAYEFIEDLFNIMQPRLPENPYDEE